MFLCSGLLGCGVGEANAVWGKGKGLDILDEMTVPQRQRLGSGVFSEHAD